MAHTTSALRTRASTEAQNNEGLPWTDAEVAVEVLKDAVATGTGGLTDTQLRATAVPVSVSGVSTAAKQPALGVALTPSTDVITSQRPAVTQVISTALEASHILKASPGQLVQLSVFNSKASAQFILVLNSTTLTADGAVTLLYPPIPIPAATLIVLDFSAPIVASTGIVVCNSSTGSFTKTIGSADCAFYAQVN